jgi:PD-(D/E)XK endonuclease
VLTSNDKGNIAEAAITLEAISLGIDVLKPVAEHGRYDLAFDVGARPLRVRANGAPMKASSASYVSGSADLGTRRVATS